MDPTALIIQQLADVLGGAFNWFGKISENNGLKIQQDITDQQNQNNWLMALFATGQSNTSSSVLKTQLLVILVAVLFAGSIVFILKYNPKK